MMFQQPIQPEANSSPIPDHKISKFTQNKLIILHFQNTYLSSPSFLHDNILLKYFE
ncbi:hypothetical protein SAMN05192538_0682 [Bacillus velezensis]|nr:hypothetical protein KOF112_11080 [Bacillus velezensis]SDI94728.1 hypothetical protein SAMN05192538_0682 [Bacillus velezensis]